MTFEEWARNNPMAVLREENFKAGQAEARELVERMRERLSASENIMRLEGWPENRKQTLDLIAEADKFLGKGK